MDILDTRDLIKTREDLQNQILIDFNEKFNTEHESFEDIDFNDENYNADDLEEFENYWFDELKEISEIDQMEDYLGSEFDYGVTLVNNDDFVEYVQEMLEDCGYIAKDFPTWIEIDWKRTATNVEQDYTEVSYKGNNYLGRS